jgi:hypothetical protein
VAPTLVGETVKLPFSPFRIASRALGFDPGFIDYDAFNEHVMEQAKNGLFDPSARPFFAVARARCSAGRRWLEQQLGCPVPLHPSALRQVPAGSAAQRGASCRELAYLT